MADIILGGLLADEYPYLREVIEDYVMKTGYHYEDEFAFGLELILDGLEPVRGA